MNAFILVGITGLVIFMVVVVFLILAELGCDYDDEEHDTW